TLTATAGALNSFTGWTGSAPSPLAALPGISSTGSYAANFVATPPSVTITASAGPNGTITPSGSVPVAYNGSQAFTVSADAGYVISQVLVDGTNNALAVSSGSYTFNNAIVNHTISATFSPSGPATSFTVSAYADSGATITPSGSVGVAAGGSVTFSFSANAGYAIADVAVDGASTPSAVSAGSYTFSAVASSHTISVTSKPFVPVAVDDPGDSDGSGNGGDGSGNGGSGDGGSGGDGLSAVALLATAAVLIAVAAGAAVFWFVFGPGRSFAVVKIASSVPIVGKDKARYRKAYRFSVEGDANSNVKYRIGEDGKWKSPARVGNDYEIPKEDVTATVTIEAE
ncbi:MAG: hypothetical protein LBS92_02705, partial [Candidatus Methanoplasma sp.]|nr:hypothetical protein [Candidatus Methanoplasma sp.]